MFVVSASSIVKPNSWYMLWYRRSRGGVILPWSRSIFMYGREKIEVVILDVKMPGMDGIETLAEIKRKHPLIEVVMLTGHATVASAIDGMKQGAYDYLMKPCDMDTLVAKVAQAAQKKRQHEQKIVEARIKEITSRRT